MWFAPLMLVPGLAAQQDAGPGTGVILGKVINAETKSPLSGVLVEVGPGRRLRALTDSEGRYVFRLLPPGT
ncbi:MAG: hypothetical protein HQ485_13205 [Acidobacteria bacterium]|nr:hypothetical protein [Acidobacteriota bacterium]